MTKTGDPTTSKNVHSSLLKLAANSLRCCRVQFANIEDIKQFVRASGSIGANYIEANETIGKKDFVMKIKICRREAKESGYWLRLIDTGNDLIGRRDALVSEAMELMKIFGAIIRKSEE